MKKTIVLLLVFVLGMSLLAGCGGSGSSLTGKYQMVSMDIDGENILELYAEIGLSTDNLYIEFPDGEKYSMSINDDVQEGTYKVDGKEITLDNEMKGTIEGNKIIFADDEEGINLKMVFEKK